MIKALLDDLFILSLGILLGMIAWDLVFETRPLKTKEDLEIVCFFYKGLHQVKFPIALILPLAALFILSYLSFQIYYNMKKEYWWALAAIIVALFIELYIAIPNEWKLWNTMGALPTNDKETIQRKINMVSTIRNVHLFMTILIVFAMWAVRFGKNKD